MTRPLTFGCVDEKPEAIRTKQMSDYRSLFTRSREASFLRHLATSTTTNHQHFQFNGIEISSSSVHVCVLPFPALITHTVNYITLKLSLAVSICLLGSVLFTLNSLTDSPVS